jgi:hypothetical protein
VEGPGNAVMPLSRFALALLALGLAGCSEPLGPADFAGEYALYRYDGGSLPRQYTTAHGCTVSVFDGTLRLGTDATFSLGFTRIESCPGTNALLDLSYGWSGSFDVLGPGLRLRAFSGPTVAAFVHGTHLLVPVSQPAGLTPPTVWAEFEAGASGEIVVQGTTTEGPVPPPRPPDTTTVVTIITRP